MVSMDSDVIEFLKTLNASELINRLLREYIKDNDIMSMSIPQLKAEVQCEKLEKELKKKQKEIRKNANN